MHNNREYTRYTLQHDALIVAKGFSPVSCDMANVCVGGMLLTNIGSPKLCHYFFENPACRIEVHLFLRFDNKETHFNILADVCRINQRNVGISFIHSQPKLLEALLRLRSKKDDGVLYTTSGKRIRLRKWFRSNAEQFVGKLLMELLSQTRDELESRTKSSSDLREISALRDAKAILSMTDSFLQHFMKLWKAGLDQLMAGDTSGMDAASELKVIDKSQFEGWLEVQMVATSVLNRNRSELYLLNQFLSQILEQDIDDRVNPIAPAVLGQYLHNTAAKMHLSELARPLLYHTFEKVLERAYEGILEPIFGVFEKHGLRAIRMDDIRSNWSDASPRRPVQPSAPVPQIPEDADPDQTFPGARLSGDGNILNMVRLQRQVASAVSQGEINGIAAQPATPREHITPETVLAQQNEILNLLSEKQTTLEAALRSESVVGNLPGDLSPSDWDIAELVDRIFEPVDQRTVPDELKSVVNQLRLPLFTVLLSDQSFFENHNHVARSLLNDFMALATADRVSSKNLEKLLTQVVEELTTAGEMTPELLESLAGRLQKLVKRQEMAFNRNAERIAKTYDGQERLVSARRAVARRINTLLEGKQVPDVVLELLQAGWEHAMVLGLLKEGGDSETVVEDFAVLEQLFDWLSSEADDDVVFEREIESPALLEQIEKELSTSPDPGQVRVILNKLEDVLYRDGEVTYTFVEHYTASEDVVESPVSVSEDIDDRWQERAHQMQVGEWVEIGTETGSQRMRLVWIGEDAFKFVFLTPQGMHEAHFEYGELVTKLQEGEMVRVNEGEIPFIDQSLYGIVEDLYQKMAVQAVHDSLTGCMQRREFEKQLEFTISRAKKSGDSAALIVFDIDQFGVINTSHGTSAGDMVLQKFSVLVDSWLGNQEAKFQLGRIAGNEFAMIVSPVIPNKAFDIAELVRTEFSKHKFSNGSQSFSATLSSGVVVIDEQSPDAGQILNFGALVCNAVKKSGGNGTRLYSATDDDQAHQQEVLYWLSRIEDSLEKCNLFLRAQLIKPLLNNDLPLYEILLGVRDDKGKIVSPAPFIEAGETYNKSVQIDTWVVNEIIEWMRSNLNKLDNIGAFTINLSGRSLSDNAFMEFLEEQLRQGGFPARKICFEVTETAAVANINYTADFMREIKRSGCRFALDDFGTGFSSYAYLQKLPVDFLKVDGVFVQDLHDNMTNYAMVKSISELGHFLDISTIAECVEEQAGYDALQEIGVDYVQGYLLGKPVLLSDL